jgi:hypothetical protein
MRVQTTSINVYEYSELSDKGQSKAVDGLRDINVTDDWWDFCFEDAKNIGLTITAFELDRSRNAEGEFTLSACEVAANIFRDHGESCETYKTATAFMEVWQPVFDKYFIEEGSELEDELMELEEDFRKDICEDFSIMLQNEYEHNVSDEAIIETIEANEYEFTEDGEMV